PHARLRVSLPCMKRKRRDLYIHAAFVFLWMRLSKTCLLRDGCPRTCHKQAHDADDQQDYANAHANGAAQSMMNVIDKLVVNTRSQTDDADGDHCIENDGVLHFV